MFCHHLGEKFAAARQKNLILCIGIWKTEIVTAAGAEYIKTSTGFSTAGATPEDIVLMKNHVGPNVKIKAAGGVKDFLDAELMINLGADRLGTSRLVRALKAKEN